MRIKVLFGLSRLLCRVALIGCLYTEIWVELGMWLGYDPQFNSIPFFFHFSIPFALAFLEFVSSLYIFTLISWLFYTCAAFFTSYAIELASDGETNLCGQVSLSLHALHFLLPSFHPHLIPPDENLVGHIKASALGSAALDLRTCC